MLDIKEIIEAFISWERFDHKNALSHFKQVKMQNVTNQQTFHNKLTTERKRMSARFSSTNPTLRGKVPTTYLITDIPKCKKKITGRKLR
jgi:CRISPR-associated protein (Cas_Cas02710)